MDDVYDWTEGHSWASTPTQRIIDAYASYTWTLIHGSYEMGIYPLDVGTHTVTGEVVGYGYSLPVEFEVVPEPIAAWLDIDPNTLNLASGGKWITCYIWLPGEYDEEQVAMAKFGRSKVQEMVEPGYVELTVSGELVDGTRFEGTDTIKVIDKGHKKKSAPECAVQVTEVKIIRCELVGNKFEEIEEIHKVRVGDVFIIVAEISNLGSETEHVFNLYGWDLSPENCVEVIGSSIPCAAYYDLKPGDSADLGPFCRSQQ